MDTNTTRKRRRASLGYSIKVQVLVTPDTASDIRTVADLREVSDGEVVRQALSEYLPDAVRKAKWTTAKRKKRT